MGHKRTPTRNPAEAVYLRLADCPPLYGLGLNKLKEIAGKAGAIKKLGRITLVERLKLEEYLSALPSAQADEKED